MRPLVPLFNRNRVRCAELVERLVAGPLGSDTPANLCVHLSPLITPHGTRLFPYILHWVPDIGRRLLNQLLNCGDETKRIVAAWHVMNRSFQDPSYVREADEFIEEGNVFRRLAADVASQAIITEEFRERAERQLLRFFNDEDKAVRKQAADVFRHVDPAEFARFYRLAEAYVASRAFEDDAFGLFDALEKATSSVHELVVFAAERLIAEFEAQEGTAGRRSLDLNQLQGLLKREYGVSENDPELRRRLLDVIDTMLERDLYGTEEIVKAHERE